MSSRRIISLVTALILAVGALAPVTAYGDRAPHNETSFIVSAAADETTGDAADDAGKTERKGGGFGRALSAPFRALARLFGGGKKRPKEEAKKKDDKATATAAAPVVAGRDEREERKPGSRGDEPRNVTATTGANKTRPAEASAESTRIVRPAEARPAPYPPGLWIPVIEGIPKDPLTQGRVLLQHGYLNEAIAELSIAATVGPNLVEANNLLGLAYDRIGLHRTAIEAYERALTVAPKDPFVLANLGNSLYLDGRYDPALKRLKRAAKLSPGTAVIHNNLGVVQAQAGKYGDAFKSFARAGGDYDAHVKLAGILETVKREKDAAKHYEAALRIQPGTSALLERLVAIYERTGRQDKADTARRTLGQPKNEQKTTTGGG